MKFNYEGNSLKSGIYQIVNIHTNRVYIGQAKEFKARWKGHYSSLLTGIHANRFLLNDFSKCKEKLGHDDFLEFHVLEVMNNSTKEERNLREQYWINNFSGNRERCYNIRLDVINDNNGPSKNPEETRFKHSQTMRQIWNDPEQKKIRVEKIRLACNTAEIKTKRSQTSKKVWASGVRSTEHLRTIEQRNRVRERNKKIWGDPEQRTKRLTAMHSSEATQKRVNSFKQNTEALSRIAKNNRKRAKHWGCLSSPQGELVEITNLSAFCQQHQLPVTTIKRILQGKCKSKNGWCLATFSGRESKTLIQKINVSFVSIQDIPHHVCQTAGKQI